MKFHINNHTYMMNYLKRKSFVIVLCGSVYFFSGCKKFVQISPPNTELVTTSVFNNSATATAALTNIYQEMYSNSESYNMALETGFLGDELTNYSSILQYIQYYSNSMTATPNTFGPWNNAYNYIYQANAVIEGVQNNNAISLGIQQQLVGESLFIRAFWHFYLTNCYGDIPVVTTSSYATNASLARTPQTQVYRQIINDLLDAQSLLNSNFVDASDTTVTTTDRTRPNKWAATALLARAYLYDRNYDSAVIEATAVINNTALFSLLTNLDSVFLVNSLEAIWQLGVPLPNHQDTPDGSEFILFGIPTKSAISVQLLSAFEPGDQRRVEWIDSFVTTKAPIDTFYFPYKYKVSGSAPNYKDGIMEYNVMLRLAEQFLIRAEAEAQGNDLKDATNDLNIIRNRAGLANISNSIASIQSSLVAAILHEKQVELFTEWGSRWFDLIRTGNVNSVMGDPENICAYKHGTWNAYDILFPIPQSERNNDPNLTQNMGY